MAELEMNVNGVWGRQDSEGRRRSLTYDFIGPLVTDNWENNGNGNPDLPSLSLEGERELYNKISADADPFAFPDPLELFQGLNLTSALGSREQVNFDGLCFEGFYANAHCWKGSYQRNYRKLGGKNLRCFPYCNPVHQTSSFCGDSLKFNLKLVSHHRSFAGTDVYTGIEGGSPLRYCAVAEFVNPGAHVDLKLGSLIAKEVVEKRISSKGEGVVWWPGNNLEESSKSLNKSVQRRRSKIGEFTEHELEDGVMIEFNKEKRAWYCDAGKNDNSHSVRVYVFSFIAPTTSSLGGDLCTDDHFKCVAMFDSPVFHLHARKSKSTANVLTIDRKGSKRNFNEMSFNTDDGFSEALDSFGDSDDFDLEHVTTLDDFDLDELDRYATPKQQSAALSRKRSFLDKSVGDQSSASTYYAEDELFVGSITSPSTGLKKMRSARNIKFTALDNLLDDFVPSKEIFSNREHQHPQSAPASIPPLARCASAPAMKLTKEVRGSRLNDKVQDEQARLVYCLFRDIINQKKGDKFVSIVTKFLTSENETLTTTLQSLLKNLVSSSTSEGSREQQAMALLASCFNFLEKNFPPFRVYCSKHKDDAPDAAFSTILATLVPHQFGYVPRNVLPPTNCSSTISYSLHNLMNKIRGTWNFKPDTLLEAYRNLGLPEPLANCYATMDSTVSFDFEPDMKTLIVKRKEKLFSSGMQRIVFDGMHRPWTLSSPLLLENPLESYCSTVGPNDEEFCTDVFVKGGQIRVQIVFRLSANLEFEVSIFKQEQGWALHYSSLLVGTRAM